MRGGLLFYMMYLGSSPERHLTKQKPGGGGGVIRLQDRVLGGFESTRQASVAAIE